MGITEFFKYAGRAGLWQAIRTLRVTKDFKVGVFKGVDKFGNRYYESLDQPFGRQRWVKYAKQSSCQYDATQIDHSWWPWMHHVTDTCPTDVPLEEPKFQADYKSNVTFSKDSYKNRGHYLNSDSDRVNRPRFESWTKQK